MALERRFSSLEEMAERSLKSRHPPEGSPRHDVEEAYRAALGRDGVKNRWTINEFLFEARHASEEWEMFAEDHSDAQILIELGKDFARTCAKCDKRDADRVFYSAETVLCVVFLA